MVRLRTGVLAPVLGAMLAFQGTPVRARTAVDADLQVLAALDTSGDPASALARIDAGLERARKDPRRDRTAELLAEANRGEALFWLSRYREALASFEHVDQGLAALGGPMTPRWAEVVNNIGSVHSSLGELDEAARYKQRALELSARLTGTESSEYAAALYGAALVDYRRGRVLEAVPRIEQAIAIASPAAQRTGHNVELPTVAGITLASIEMQAGDSASAVTAARGAALWAEAHLGSEHRLTLAALNQLGAALNDGGLYGQATPILRRTLDLRVKTLPRDHPDIAYSLNALAFALEHGGYPDEALPFYERSAAMFEALPRESQPMSGANTFGQIGRIAARNGESERALELFRKALALARRNASSPDDLEVLWAEVNLATALAGRGELGPAQALLDHALAGYALRAQPGNPDRVTAAVWRAALMGLQGAPQQALDEVRRAVAPLRDHLLDRANPQAEVSRLRLDVAAVFVEEARVALAAGDGGTAFDALQMATMGDLQASMLSLGALGADAAGGPVGQALGDYRAAKARLREVARNRDRAIGLGESAGLPALQREVEAAQEDVRRRDGRLAALVPGYAALTGFAPTSLADARAGLRRGEGMVLYGQDTQGLVVMAVTGRGVTQASVPVVPRHLLDLQRKIRASIDDGMLAGGLAPFDRQSAHALYSLLFPAPVERALKGVRKVRVLAAGTLAALPFDALVTAPPRGDDDDPEALRRTAWFVRRHAVSMIVSMAPPVRRSGRPSRGGDAATGFAGIGALRSGAWKAALAGQAAQGMTAEANPRLVQLAALPDLPGAQGELTAMARRFGRDSLLLTGDAASEAAVKAAPLDRMRVLAFATHGLVGGAQRNLVEPALVLAPPGPGDTGDDGLLTASEIARLRLDADWVILSACDTSAGESENAPTYSGLARAFIAAGARAMLLSHWPVRDEVAGRITLYTVKAAGGGAVRHGSGRAEALRRAQLRIIADRTLAGSAHPAIWAPFVLVGD